MLSISGATLALGSGLRADKCQRRSSTVGNAFAVEVGCLQGRWGMCHGGLMRTWDRCMGKVLGQGVWLRDMGYVRLWG